MKESETRKIVITNISRLYVSLRATMTTFRADASDNALRSRQSFFDQSTSQTLFASTPSFLLSSVNLQVQSVSLCSEAFRSTPQDRSHVFLRIEYQEYGIIPVTRIIHVADSGRSQCGYEMVLSISHLGVYRLENVIHCNFLTTTKGSSSSIYDLPSMFGRFQLLSRASTV